MAEERVRDIAELLVKVVTPDMTPKQLMKAIQKKHPKASKKDIVRAAFYVVLSQSDSRPGLSEKLHDFAMNERTRNAA